MAWTSTVTNKTVTGSGISVTIQYTDGTRIITDAYNEASPYADWIPKTVRNRIAQLTAIYGYDVPIGIVTPANNEPSEDLNESLFLRRVRALQFVKVMIDLGVIPADNAKVVALTTWIKNNATAYFDKLVS